MAQAFAIIHGGRNIEAYSAGSKPSGRINPKAIEAMKELGYDLASHTSKSIGDLPKVEFDAVIGMGCGDEACPLIPGKIHEEWNIPDPKEMDAQRYMQVAGAIEQRVKKLLQNL